MGNHLHADKPSQCVTGQQDQLYVASLPWTGTVCIMYQQKLMGSKHNALAGPYAWSQRRGYGRILFLLTIYSIFWVYYEYLVSDMRKCLLGTQWHRQGA